MIIHEQSFIQHHDELYKKEKGLIRGVYDKIGAELIVSFKHSHLLCKITGKHPKGSKVKVLAHKFYEIKESDLSPLHKHAIIENGFINLEKFTEIANANYEILKKAFLEHIKVNDSNSDIILNDELVKIIKNHVNRTYYLNVNKYYIDIDDIRYYFLFTGIKRIFIIKEEKI